LRVMVASWLRDDRHPGQIDRLALNPCGYGKDRTQMTDVFRRLQAEKWARVRFQDLLSSR
jgi:hypothetical protein